MKDSDCHNVSLVLSCINKSLESVYIVGETTNEKTNTNENELVANGIIDTEVKSISKHTHDIESALETLRESEDSRELKNDIQCNINESLESAYIAGEWSNEKTKNIE